MKRSEVEKYKKGSQSGILYDYIVNCISVFVIGVVLLILLLGTNHVFFNSSNKEISAIYNLNQFRSASKRLTIAVTSYVASGNEKYSEEYMTELLETKTREKTIQALKELDLSEAEMEELNKLASLSDGLIPNEKMAIELKGKNRSEDAKTLIFSSFYSDTTTQISDETDKIIQMITDRLESEKDRIRLIQIIIEALFTLTLTILMIVIVRTIRFARTEILHPVMKVSEQLLAISDGDLHKNIDLKEDDSEVGSVARAIRIMKRNWSDMIYEIAFSLEEMSRGNYALEFSDDYVGEFVTIKECLQEIVDGMKEIIITISNTSNDINEGAIQLSKAADTLAQACTTQAMEVSDIILYLQGIAEETRANEKDAEEAVKISYLARSTVDLEEQRINRLRVTINDAVRCIEEMSTVLEMKDMSDETQELIKSTMDNLENILNSMDDAVSELEDMKLGTEETSQRIERIVNNFKNEIENIDKISENLNSLGVLVDSNSATAEETAAISEQQKGQVSNLVKLIDDFKV